MLASMLRNKLHMDSIEAENGHIGIGVLEGDKKKQIAVVLLDINMPVMNGWETLQKINTSFPSVPVVILSGDNSIEDAAEAIRRNARDYLAKPVVPELINKAVRKILKSALLTKPQAQPSSKSARTNFNALIGSKGSLAPCVAMGIKAASTELPVLIEGETGTGKEIFASAIHAESARKDGPFIAINCGALPEKLIESILFGHEKGAFTGAVAKNPGKFQEANGGSVFLDEVGDLPLDAQVKLLRVLQEKEVDPVGASRPVPVDIRLISATHRNLESEVRAGRFREDLYYRINVLQITMPPLSERKQDIPELAMHFIDKFSRRYNIPPKRIPPDLIARFLVHQWPGNVRELENYINRFMVLDDVSLGFRIHPAKEAERHDDTKLDLLEPNGCFKTLQKLETEILKIALRYHEGNMSLTARTLGMAKSTLYTKIQTPGNDV